MPAGDENSDEERDLFRIADDDSLRYATPEARRSIERRAVEAILRRLPEGGEGDRAQFRELMLNPPPGACMSVGSDVPGIARLLDVFHAARNAGRLVSAEAAPLAPPDDRIPQVRVTVAVVDQLSPVAALATIIRRPGDEGRALLLLQESNLSPVTVGFGLRAASSAVARHGPDPDREHTMNVLTVERDHVGQATAWSDDSTVALIQAAPVRHIEGIGFVRAVDVVTRAEPA